MPRCAHRDQTRQGSNHFVDLIKCRDCGEILFKHHFAKTSDQMLLQCVRSIQCINRLETTGTAQPASPMVNQSSSSDSEAMTATTAPTSRPPPSPPGAPKKLPERLSAEVIRKLTDTEVQQIIESERIKIRLEEQQRLAQEILQKGLIDTPTDQPEADDRTRPSKRQGVGQMPKAENAEARGSADPVGNSEASRRLSSRVKSCVLGALIAATTALGKMPGTAWEAAETYGRLDLAEVACVSDSRLTHAMIEQGGKAERFSNWNGYDFSTRSGAEKLVKALRVKRPRRVWFSPPCGAECPWQNLNPVTAESEKKLINTRRIQRNVKWAIGQLLNEGFCDIYLEQSGRCRSWTGNFKELKESMHGCRIHGCMYDMRDEQNGLLIRKDWHIATTDPQFEKKVGRICPDLHLHMPLEGGTRVALSANYPVNMCRRIAQHFMTRATSDEALAYLVQAHNELDDELCAAGYRRLREKRPQLLKVKEKEQVDQCQLLILTTLEMLKVKSSRSRKADQKLIDLCSHYECPGVEEHCGNTTAKEMKEVVLKDWIHHYGKPEVFRTDPEGCFRQVEQRAWVSGNGMEWRPEPGEAHWRMGVIERCIETIKEIATRLAWELPDDTEPADIFRWACVANNDLMRHQGYSPMMLMMGRTPSEQGLEQVENPSVLSANVVDKHFQEVTRIKAAAYKACVDHYLSEKTKRALLAKTRPFKTWEPGEKAHYWRGAKGNSHKTRPGIAGRFHGPATVLMQEREMKNGVAVRRGVVWLVDGDRLVRAAAAHLRTTTKAEQTLESISAGSSDHFKKILQKVPTLVMPELGRAEPESESSASWISPWEYDQQTKASDLVGFVGEDEPNLAIMIGFALEESDVDQLSRRPDKALAAMVKQNKVEVKLKNLTAEDREKLPIAKGNEIKSFLKYRVCEAASRAGVHPGALMKMRWVITRKETGDRKARLVVLGFTDPGLAVAHVDDFMIAIDQHSDFAVDALQQLHQAYEWGSWETQDFVQCGTRIRQEYDGRTKSWGRIHLTMIDYAQELIEIDIPAHRRRDPEQPATPSEATRLRAAFGQLVWLATQGVPLVGAELSLLLAYSNSATVNTLLQANKLIRRTKFEATKELIMEKHATPCVVGYSDAAWNVRRDGSSQGGFLIFLTDYTLMQNREAPISLLAWASAKLPRACRSSSAAEVQAASEAQEELEFCRLLLSEILLGPAPLKQWTSSCAKIPGALVLDCRGVFDALDRSESSALGMKDKRSALEALALKRGMAATSTSLRWCHSGAQLSDCMTKNSEKARASYNLWLQRGTWKLIYDANFISEKQRRQRGLQTRDQATYFAVDDDDAWQLYPEDLEIEEEVDIPQ
ncbi:unnamed protein product, partial [Prorocentrum cordatum]